MSMFTSVVLPAPVGPTIATTSPGCASSETCCSTGVSGSYAKLTSSKRMSPRNVMSTASGESAGSISVSMISITRSACAAAY